MKRKREREREREKEERERERPNLSGFVLKCSPLDRFFPFIPPLSMSARRIVEIERINWV